MKGIINLGVNMKYLKLFFVFFLLPVFLHSQALSRVWGYVYDSQGKPIEGVLVSVTCPEIGDYKKETKTDKKGQYDIAVTDGTKVYQFTLSKEGYLEIKENVKPKIMASIQKDFTLKTKAEIEKELYQKEMEENPHLKEFEEGRKALEQKNLKKARTHFENALKIKPDYYKVMVILAALDEEEGKLDEAIEKAEKALVSSEDAPTALRVLISVYNKKGNKQKAMEYQKKLTELEPDSPESLFNKAADLLNAKKDAEAKPLLEKAISIDPKFSSAYYELGFIYLREGNMEKAKEIFQEFLKLEPQGSKADIVKETLKYL